MEEGEGEAEQSDAEDEETVEPLALTPNRQGKRAAAAEVRE